METWMSGGIGRAQGGYDEMVFRAMVRDDAHFYQPAGRGLGRHRRPTSKTMANAYLYGTRFFSYLALTHSPEKVVDWLSRGRGQRPLLRHPVRAGVRQVRSKPPGATGSPGSTNSRTTNLASVRAFPLTAGKRVSRAAPSARCRKSYVDPSNDTMIGAFLYPGVVSHVGTVSLADGHVERLVDVKGPMQVHRDLDRVRCRRRDTFFYTADNVAYRDLMALDLGTGKARMLLSDARIGDLVFNPSDRSLLGVRHENGYITLVRIPAPYKDWNQVITLPYGQVLFDLDISPDGKLLSLTMEEIDSKQYLRVFSHRGPAGRRTRSRSPSSTSAPRCRRASCSRPTAATCSAAPTTPACPTCIRFEIASSEVEAVTNAETGFFRPIPRADGALIALEYSGTASCRPCSRPSRSRISARSPSWASKIAATAPGRDDLERRLAGSDRRSIRLVTDRGKYVPPKQMQLDGGYPIVQGYRDSVALGYQYGFADPLQYNLGITRQSVGRRQRASRTNACTCASTIKTLDWHFRYWHNDADFYDLFGPTKRSRKGDAFIVGYTQAARLRRAAPARAGRADVAYYTGLDTLPGNQNVPAQFEELISARGRPGLQQHAASRRPASITRRACDWTLFAVRRPCQRRDLPEAQRRLRFRLRAALGQFVGLALQRRRRRQRRRQQQRSPTSISAASATTTSTTAR